MTSPDEVELKLDLTAEAADALESADLLGAAASISELTSIYFDTQGQDLFQAGLSLRIRRSGDTRIQTVKAGNGRAAGLFARPEWERAIEGDKPVLDERMPAWPFLKDCVGNIAPAFEVRVERRTWNLAMPDASIELVIDRGEIRAEGRTRPVCEAELELKDGDTADLFALARRMDAIVPVRLGVLSKAERGYSLLGKVKRAYKAEPVLLDVQMSGAAAFRAIAHSCLRQYRLNESILLENAEPDALHQARVAIRRLRSAFSIFKALTDDDEAAHLKQRLRDLAAVFADARSIDVLLEQVDSDEIRDQLLSARGAAYARVGEMLASAEPGGLMLDLAEWLENGGWLRAVETRKRRDMPAPVLAARALSKLRRKLKKDGRHLESLDDEGRHQVRKDAKKLRYASEFFASLFDGDKEKRRHRKFVDALERLQDQLGALNDLASAPQILEAVGVVHHADAQRLFNAERKAELLDGAAKAFEELMDARRFWS